MADTDKISQRAHEIWEREGRPDGQSERHWHEAAASLEVPERAPVEKAAAKKAEKPAKAEAVSKPKKTGKPEKAKPDAKPAKKPKSSDAAKGDAKKAETGKKASGKSAKKGS